MIRFRGKVFASLIVASFFASAFGASAGLLDVIPEMGDLQRWAVFTLGQDQDADFLGKKTVVQGDVGAAGNGNINLTGNATVEGDLYYRSNGTLDMSPNATVTGSRFNDQDPLLDNTVIEARHASRHASDLQRTWFLATTIDFHHRQSITATGAPGETVVLGLGKFKLSDNATFTLQGTATTTYIINVRNEFSLADNAQIILAGGVQWSNVLFNVRGKNGKEGPISLSGDSRFQGILLAKGRTVHLNDNSNVQGQVIANKVMFDKLNGNSSVTRPLLVSD